MKRALICGTKERSAGRIIGEYLLTAGWEVFLYSRNGNDLDLGSLHIRCADVINERSVKRLLVECEQPDLVICSADAGGVCGELSDLLPGNIRTFLDAKIFGSILLLQQIVATRYKSRVVFLCGSRDKKAADLLLYGVANAAIMSLVETFNANFAPTPQSYYLETPLLRDSPKETEYREVTGKHLEGLPAIVLVGAIEQIMSGDIEPGFVPFTKGLVI